MRAITKTTATGLGALPLCFYVFFRALVRLPDQPIRVISLANESLTILHDESAKNLRQS